MQGNIKLAGILVEENGHRTDMSTTGRAQAAAAVVRRLNAAVKSRRLYGPEHQLRAQTVSAFLATATAYHERFGSFVLETHRKGLIVEGQPFEGGESVDSLALLLYGVGVWQLILLPGITEAEASAFLEIVTMERDAILAEGGFTDLLSARGLEHARVVELRPGEDDPANISLESFQQLVDGSLPAHERAALLGLLRAGADQAKRLLGVVLERTRQAYPNASGAELGARMYGALNALDRLVVDTPQGESQDLLQHLASAVADVDDLSRNNLHATILQRAAEDLSARALLTAMTSGQIARMVIDCLEAGDPPPQVAQVAKGLPFDPAKARDTLAIISQQTGRSFDLPVVLEELRLPAWIHNIQQDLLDFNVADSDVAVSDDDVQALAAEVQLDDATLAREHTLTLLHLSLVESDARELDATLTALVNSAETLLQWNSFEVVGAVLQAFETVAGRPGAAGEPGHAAMRRLLGTIAGTVSVKDVWRWTDDQPLLRCLRQVGRSASASLAHALSTERDPARRQVITAILAKLGDEYVESLTKYLSDPNPEVARHIVQALAQMRSSRAIAALQPVARHPDARTRKEAISVLGAVQVPAAQDALLAFLHDPDPTLIEQSLSHLKPEAARRVTRDLITMVAARDTRRWPALRIRLIGILSETGAVEAMPALRRLGSPFKLRKRDREVARHARQAVARLRRAPGGARLQNGVAS